MNRDNDDLVSPFRSFLMRLAVGETTGPIDAAVGQWERFYTKEGVHPFDEIEWKKEDARILAPDGRVVFELLNVEVPAWWGPTTVNIVADKYLRVINGVREVSVRQMITRVSSTLRQWAEEQHFFATSEDADIYEAELCYALLHQHGAFNSPVWFNIGVPGRAQAASACYIVGVDDSLDSIMDFQRAEIEIFHAGSGSGANLSKLRSSYERLSSGSYVSGPLAWMRGFDQHAAAMKSGGSTRSAAKMVVLDLDHPDILETRDGRPGFIRCKATEEKRAYDLIKIGYSAAWDDPNSAYKAIAYQAANLSVSVPDAFMLEVLSDGAWQTRERINPSSGVVQSYRARDLWREIAQAAWSCGDPGIQFTDTINRWHTTPESGRIRASNPCSEFLHIDNTACNLCALNLTKFFSGGENHGFDQDSFAHSVRLFSTAQMAIVGKAEYPTEAIRKNSLRLRPIGTNYGNLGALLMSMGYGYDSEQGRAVAARMASLMTGLVYLNSAAVASRIGPFDAFSENRDAMLQVMRMHRDANQQILSKCGLQVDPLGNAGLTSVLLWRQLIALGEEHGYNVSQATLQAPLGTISFLMGMSTTGIEPAFALVSNRSLVGGGTLRQVNQAVWGALTNLGYSEHEIGLIRAHLETTGTLEGVREEHLSIFDCAIPGSPGGRCLTPLSHIKMMAAIQPLITCAMSKTVNVSKSTTVDEVATIYQTAWSLGLKCVALYRDGCKVSQVLTTITPEQGPDPTVERRRRLADDVTGWRHKFSIGGFDGYAIVNHYEDGSPGEVFVKLGKSGSTVAGLLDGFTKLLSLALQYGVPLQHLVGSFVDTRFEPSGFTRNPAIRSCSSLYDYLFRLLGKRYLSSETVTISPETIKSTLEAPPCLRCGGLTQRNGTCYVCTVCGQPTGCS